MTVDPIRSAEKTMRVSFYCTTSGCFSNIETFVEPAHYDASRGVDDAISRTSAATSCGTCNTTYFVEVYGLMDGPHFSVRDEDNNFIDYSAMSEGEFGPQEDYETQPPTDPYQVYVEARKNLDSFFQRQLIDARYQRTFTSMVFTQYVTLMEAYLSDRLERLVMDERNKMIAFIGSNREMREHPISLINLAKEPNILNKTVRGLIQNISFHNLERADPYYKAVLGVSLVPEGDDGARITGLIRMRHDLVHRAGKDRDGNEVYIDTSHVKAIATLSGELVSRIEGVYSEYVATKTFGSN